MVQQLCAEKCLFLIYYKVSQDCSYISFCPLSWQWQDASLVCFRPLECDISPPDLAPLRPGLHRDFTERRYHFQLLFSAYNAHVWAHNPTMCYITTFKLRQQRHEKRFPATNRSICDNHEFYVCLLNLLFTVKCLKSLICLRNGLQFLLVNLAAASSEAIVCWLANY